MSVFFFSNKPLCSASFNFFLEKKVNKNSSQKYASSHIYGAGTSFLAAQRTTATNKFLFLNQSIGLRCGSLAKTAEKYLVLRWSIVLA